MLDKLYNWLNRNKDKDSVGIIVLKLCYKLSYDWLHTVLNILLTLIMTNLYTDGKTSLFYVVLSGIVLLEIYFSLVNSYKKYKYQVQKNSDLILNEIVTATLALDDYINDNDGSGKGIFEYASSLITASMYKVLKEVTNCEIRISVIQQFHEEGKKKRKCIMISRKSKRRANCSKQEKNVEYTENKNYYFLKVLEDNIDTYIFFDTKKEIDKKFFWKNNKKRSNIYQYIGFAEKINTDDIAFLLQIDAMEKNAFGKNKDELSVFADNYIYPYLQFLRHAYNIERIIRKGD